MSKLEKLISELCPNGVEFVELSAVSEIYDGTHQTPKYTDEGVKFVSVENINSLYETKKYISYEDFNKYKIKPRINDLLMTRIGTIGVCTVVDRDEELAYYVTLALIRPNVSISTKYLKYAIESKNGRKELRKRTLINAVPIKINLGDIGRIKIPIPPLPVQEEIVRILDNFTELTTELITELTKEVKARKQQYNFYKDKLLTFGDEVEWKTLRDIAEIGTGSSNTNESLEVGNYPFFVRSQDVRRKNAFEFDETAIITSGDGVGVGKIFHYIEGKYALHQRAYRIHIIDESVNPKYYFYYMKNTFLSYIEKNAVNSSVTSIRRGMLDNFHVPIPLLKEQLRIVANFDKFDNMYNELTSYLPAEIEARQKQYEYYRDKLLTFKELEK